MKFFYSNVQSLNQKIDDMKHEIHSKNYDIIILTETWLNSNTLNKDLNLKNYTIYRKDREEGKGGGVLNAVKSKLMSKQMSICKSMEALLVKVKLKKQQINILALYRSPNPKYHTPNLMSKIERIVKKHIKNIIIVGDFNLPQINWSNISQTLGQNEISTALVNMIVNNDLKQHVNVPTHSSNSILDLIITPSHMNLFFDVNEPFSHSDHNSIVITKEFLMSEEPRFEKKLNFAKADWESISNMIQNTTFVIDQDIEIMYANFSDTLNAILTQNVPVFIVKPNVNNVPKYIRQQLKHRRQLYDAWKRCQYGSQKLTLEQTYKSKAKSVSQEIKQFEQGKIVNIINNSTSNPKILFAYCSKILSDDSSCLSFAPLSDSEASNVLARKFVADFSEPSEPMSYRQQVPHQTRQPYISMKEVKDVIRNSKSKLSHGLDGIPSVVLKKCLNELCPILTSIFNASYTAQQVPDIWRRVSITPLHKHGLKTDPQNYRPISVPSCVSKVMETIIEHRIRRQLQPQFILFQSQHGFMKGRNSTTNLLLTYGDIFESKNRGENTDIIFIDFAKAFDKINHAILFDKMSILGIDTQTINWTRSFLENRTFSVKVNTSMSTSMSIVSGIPQGTVLGPLLYNIYAYDIRKYTTNKLVSYADDTKLFKHISNDTQKRELDILSLQRDIDGIFKWACENKMTINISKCVHLRIGTRTSTYTSTYTLNNTSILEVNQYVDLGITISNDLSFKTHIKSICQKSRQLIGMFRKAFGSLLTEEAFRILYKSHIRSILEYCPSLWSPQYQSEIDELESVQRFALKVLLPQKWNQSLTQKLRNLDLNPLVNRRNNADLVECYKLMKSIYDVNVPEQLKLTNSCTRGHNMKLFKPRSTSTNVQNSFFHRIIDKWNSLPSEMVNADSLLSFKAKIKLHLNR